MSERRTRLGKVVGSYRPPLEAWTYWSEKKWGTDEDGFVVVAPSGARIEWVKTEKLAQAIVKMHNTDRVTY